MRRRLTLAALAVSLVGLACSDSITASPDLTVNSSFARSRNSVVDNMILAFFPKGLETATGTRFDHIDSKLGSWDEDGSAWSGDVTVARTQLAELVKFVANKASFIDEDALQPSETREAAAARLALAMVVYVNGGPDAIPPTLPAGSEDVTFQYVPSGSETVIQTPSGHAGLGLDAGSTGEDRLIVIALHPMENTDVQRCAGPLNTDRCQYQPFYRFESFPHTKLLKPGRFAVCHVKGELGPTQPEDAYITLAHNLPADPANYTEGATQEGDIELLPRAGVQTGVVDCNQTNTASGILGTSQRVLYAVANFAGKILSPRALHAYDQGPEHFGDFFSDFVGVGAPNFVGTWNGTTMLEGAPSGQPITVVITSQTDAGVVGEYRVALTGTGPHTAYNIDPDDGSGRFIASSSISFNGLAFTIDPFFSPFSTGIKLEHTVTRTFNSDGIPMLAGSTVRTRLVEGGTATDNWLITLTRASSALVNLPPSILVSLQAAPTGSTASSTSTSSTVPIQ